MSSYVPDCARCFALLNIHTIHELERLGHKTLPAEGVRETIAVFALCAGRLCGQCIEASRAEVK